MSDRHGDLVYAFNSQPVEATSVIIVAPDHIPPIWPPDVPADPTHVTTAWRSTARQGIYCLAVERFDEAPVAPRRTQ
jgi:hypothetical protein